MSYIPNSAMPHAQAEPESERVDWQAYADQAKELAGQARDLAGRAFGFLRAHPREAAGGAAALIAGLAFASWRSSRRGRFEFA
jgi:hypothetical protein